MRPLLAVLAALPLVLTLGCSDDAGDEAATSTTAPAEPSEQPAPDLPLGDHPDGLLCDPAGVVGLDIPADAEVEVGSVTGRVQDWLGQYAANWQEDDLLVEVHLSGTVLVDLVGERTELAEVAAGEATVWYSGNFVQLRAFTDPTDRCQAFDVTVWHCPPDTTCDEAGLDAREQRAAAAALRVSGDATFEEVALDPAAVIVARFVDAASEGDAETVEALGPPDSPITAELIARNGDVRGLAYEVGANDGTVPLQLYSGNELTSVPVGCQLRATVDDDSITSIEPMQPCPR